MFAGNCVMMKGVDPQRKEPHKGIAKVRLLVPKLLFVLAPDVAQILSKSLEQTNTMPEKNSSQLFRSPFST